MRPVPGITIELVAGTVNAVATCRLCGWQSGAVVRGAVESLAWAPSASRGCSAPQEIKHDVHGRQERGEP